MSNFKCSGCIYVSNEKTNTTKHIKKNCVDATVITELIYIECDFCNTKFDSVKGLKKHILSCKLSNKPNTLKQQLELQQKEIEVFYGPNNFEKFLDERKDLYDVVIISRPHIAIKYIDIIKTKAPECVIIFDTVDLHFLRMSRQAKIDNTVSKSELEKTKSIELALMEKSDLTILTSMNEAKLLHSDYPNFRFVLIPFIRFTNE